MREEGRRLGETEAGLPQRGEKEGRLGTRQRSPAPRRPAGHGWRLAGLCSLQPAGQRGVFKASASSPGTSPRRSLCRQIKLGPVLQLGREPALARPQCACSWGWGIDRVFGHEKVWTTCVPGDFME